MNNDTNSLSIESKLSTFFDKERAEAHAPVDLFDRIEGRLAEQDSRRGWTRVFSFASGHGQMLGIGIAATLVIAVGVMVTNLTYLAPARGEPIAIPVPADFASFDSLNRAPDQAGSAGAAGVQGVAGARGDPGPGALATPAAAAITSAPVVQTVEVERVVTEQVVQTVIVSAQGTIVEAVVTATPGPIPPPPSPNSPGASADGTGTNPEIAITELPPEPSATFFENYGVNPFSTFAMDVDTASYTLTRGWLNAGRVPPPDAIRVEEFVNYFDQEYPDTTETFGINIDASASPFHNDGRILLRVGVNGLDVADDDRRVATITFVIDTSGSMGRDNRLGLVQRSIGDLVSNLRDGDGIGVVEYGSTARRLLEPTVDKAAVLTVVNLLVPRYSTNA